MMLGTRSMPADVIAASREYSVMIRVFGEYAQECSQRGDDDKAMWGLFFQSDVLDVALGKSALEFYSTPFIFSLRVEIYYVSYVR